MLGVLRRSWALMGPAFLVSVSGLLLLLLLLLLCAV
jgi:hypothetical protein